ncbi:hypothetical protein [Microbacterium maritypicum]|uniref:Uncharacterized protein n=1 Tax=Microbacterium maritypicum MF109 TaxID=1333857 RepID=T5KUG5_MICMQ|nr:hypothetical protein [Microbacterium liquefaciens]EQM83397.1 hypothetical protein L687_12315 [Microbacterium maritypicum MF109]
MTTTENYHHVELKLEGGELHRGFTCTAPEDAPCRRRPKDADRRESWTAEEATESGHPCWAYEWVGAVGIEDAIIGTVDDQVLASVPVTISFEEGVGIEPITTAGEAS